MDFSGWEKLSLVDFDDNITTTLFAAGCNMRCPFCHNMDLVIHPLEAPQIPWEEIYDFLKNRKTMLDGVCISGGEPTLMNDLHEKMVAIKELGYKIKLDSNGSNPEMLKVLIHEGLVDYVAMDIKNSPACYRETIGCPNFDMRPIFESVDLLKLGHIPYEFRTTIIEEFHSEEDMIEIGKWIARAPRYFLQLYVDSEHCIQRGFHAISDQKAHHFLDLLKPYVPNAKLRSYE